MRKWSRYLGVLCFIYLAGLFLFHRQLGPEDYLDVREFDPPVLMAPSAPPANKPRPDSVTRNNNKNNIDNSNNNSSNALPMFPEHSKLVMGRLHHLQQLEAGMTKLEQEINNYKSKLAAEEDKVKGDGGVKGGSKVDEDKVAGGGKVAEDDEVEVAEQDEAPAGARAWAGDQQWEDLGPRDAQEAMDLTLRRQQEINEEQGERLSFEREERWRQRQRARQYKLQRQRQQARRNGQFRMRIPGQDYYDDMDMARARRMEQHRVRPFRQPGFHPDRMPPARFPQGKIGWKEDQGFVESRKQPEPEEDYTGTSLVKIGRGLAVYAAYHDDRIPTKPMLRLIVIITSPKVARRALCHFKYDDIASTIPVEAEQYELCENHKKRYLGFFYSCPVPRQSTDASVTYSVSMSLLTTPDERVPVPSVQYVTPAEVRGRQVSEEKHQYKYNYSICVSPLFGSVMAKRLVEFIEMSRILGAQHVFFYDFQISSVIRRVLGFYEEKGWVTLLPWKLPSTMDNTNIWYHGQLVTNNDCLYRTMAVSAFTAFHDIDEFIVPHAPGIKTWGDMLPSVFPNDTCGYSFKSSFFDPSVNNGQFREDDLITLSVTSRPAMVSRIRTKVMVAPRRVFEVGIHHISKQFLEHWAPQQYDASHALIHHYRDCMRDYGMRCENWVKDTTVRDKYLTQLKGNFEEAVRTLRL